MIQLENVHKNYVMGDAIIHAVENASIRIEKGEFVAVIGPSGSGKSTLMHLLGALDLASSGSIFLDGHDIERLSDSELAVIRGRKIGFVFQSFNLIPTLTALENVMLPMMFQNVPLKNRRERAGDLLKEVGLGHRLSHLPNQLSGGERQRVAIARALANDPEIILADEPTGNLDTKTGKEIVSLLEGLNKKGKTIIMVTHEPEIAGYAKRTIRIKDGRIEK
ncbi:ABC transporter ATP-binding protein [Candidatus Pacearchaeota archaeon]|nr:ABC transporter ATP-binding protein [Candidatus Pacearchaeota archaeon]